MQIITTGKNAVYYSESSTEDGSTTSTSPIPGSENVVEEVTIDDENYEARASKKYLSSITKQF